MTIEEKIEADAIDNCLDPLKELVLEAIGHYKSIVSDPNACGTEYHKATEFLGLLFNHYNGRERLYHVRQELSDYINERIIDLENSRPSYEKISKKGKLFGSIGGVLVAASLLKVIVDFQYHRDFKPALLTLMVSGMISIGSLLLGSNKNPAYAAYENEVARYKSLIQELNPVDDTSADPEKDLGKTLYGLKERVAPQLCFRISPS